MKYGFCKIATMISFPGYFHLFVKRRVKRSRAVLIAKRKFMIQMHTFAVPYTKKQLWWWTTILSAIQKNLDIKIKDLMVI